MIEITEKSKCTGCSACSRVCPKQCITMRADDEGFLYPVVEKADCINCGACDRVCPVTQSAFKPKEEFPPAYLMYDKDESWRKSSAAGGGFAALARYFLEKYHGVVFGAMYDEAYHVYHCMVEDEAGLRKLQKSKYVQSDVKHTFDETKTKLAQKQYVLYSGTPCQIYGLKHYLGTLAESPYLYCVDLSCHGVPSPRVFEKYLACLQEREGSKLASFTMRDKRFKRNAYDQGFGIAFENGDKQFNEHTRDLFGRCFWGEIASRPSCYDCRFKTIWRTADITLGDCWFMNCFVPEEQDTSGVTLALVHSDKGRALIENADTIVKYEAPSEKLIKANGGMLYSSAVPHPRRKEFFARLDTEPFDRLVDELLPAKRPSAKQRALKLLDAMGLRLEFLRKKSRGKKLRARLNKAIPAEAKGELR